MKKFFAALLIAGSIGLSACAATTYTADGTANNLKGKGYTTEVLSYDLAKVKIRGLNYDIVAFTNAVYAEKGTGDDADLLMAFFFPNINDAEKFVSGNSYENLGLMNNYGDSNLGKNLTKKVGTHNNVAYIGSVTSFSAAFN